MGVTELPTVYDIAPGWIGTSKRDGYEASEIAGDTALTAAKTFGINVVSGTQDEWDSCPTSPATAAATPRLWPVWGSDALWIYDLPSA